MAIPDIKSDLSSVKIQDEPVYKLAGWKYLVNKVRVFDDFIGVTKWSTATGGGGFSGQYNGVLPEPANPEDKSYHLLQLSGGPGAGLFASVYFGPATTANTTRIFLNRAKEVVEASMLLRTPSGAVPVSTALQYFFGYRNTTNGAFTAGVYFRANKLISLNYQAVCTNGGISTVVDTGIVITNADEKRFRIEIDENSIDAKFYINNVLVATINTNLPAANVGLFVVGLLETNGTNDAANNRTAYIDWVQISRDFKNLKTV